MHREEQHCTPLRAPATVRLVELLLAHGADPNSYIDSSGSATYVAQTRELRALLFAHGGTLDTYDLVWLGEDDEVVRRVSADPRSANSGCGGVFAAACTQGKRDLVVRLLAAGARVPPVVDGCRSYLWSDPVSLRLLLESGMDPDLPNWQHATPLHDLCGRDSSRPSAGPSVGMCCHLSRRGSHNFRQGRGLPFDSPGMGGTSQPA